LFGFFLSNYVSLTKGGLGKFRLLHCSKEVSGRGEGEGTS